MTTRSPERTGFLIVRLWIEGNRRDGLRARITQTLDSTGDEHKMTTAATPEEIYAVVQTWVEALLDPAEAPTLVSGDPVTLP
ncbi:MAG: hypothetical protein ABI869_00145 [Actinomycetota bacterium]